MFMRNTSSSTGSVVPAQQTTTLFMPSASPTSKSVIPFPPNKSFWKDLLHITWLSRICLCLSLFHQSRSVYLCVCLSVCLYVCMFVWLSIHACLSICLPVCPPFFVCLFVCLVSLIVCLSVCRSVCVWLVGCAFDCLFVCLSDVRRPSTSVCLSACPHVCDARLSLAGSIIEANCMRTHPNR